MKYLIIGLGNMDKDYFGTRHNMGFEVVDALAMEKGATWSSDSLCHRTTIRHKGHQLILIKPTTFMNLSGKAVKYWMQKDHVDVDQILVVLDDLNLNYGTIRMRSGGNDGGHNGLKDIDLQLNTNQYPRLRVGIGNQYAKGHQINYVLGKWNKEEIEILPKITALCAEAILSFCASGLNVTMNQYNSKKIE